MPWTVENIRANVTFAAVVRMVWRYGPSRPKKTPLHDERLAIAIAQEPCEPIPDAPFEERLEKAKACANNPVPSGLRALAFDRKPPFHYIDPLVKAGVLAEREHQPQIHRANECREGGFPAKRLQVINPRTRKTLFVRAANSYTGTGFVRVPGIQLSPKDAKALFEGRPLPTLEEVIVVPLE